MTKTFTKSEVYCTRTTEGLQFSFDLFSYIGGALRFIKCDIAEIDSFEK